MEDQTKPRLEGLGKAISEAIALRELIFSCEEKIREVESNIESNENDIARIERLKQQTIQLRQTNSDLGNELAALKAELDKRINKFERAGIKLPLNKEENVKALVNL